MLLCDYPLLLQTLFRNDKGLFQIQANEEMSMGYSRKWIPFFVWATIAATCLVLGVAENSVAQPVSFGIKTGVPLNQLISRNDGLPVQRLTQHYVIGPVIDVRLPGNFSLEVGVLYKQIDQQSANVFLVGFTCLTCEEGPYGVYQSQSVSRVGRSWEYPVVMQYHFATPAMLRPYVEGGHSYNHLSGIFVNPTLFLPYNARASLPQLVSAPYATNMKRSGFLLGAGVEIKLPLIHLTPGFRYSRYDQVEVAEPNLRGIESPKSLDFLVGINLNSLYHRAGKPKQ